MYDTYCSSNHRLFENSQESTTGLRLLTLSTLKSGFGDGGFGKISTSESESLTTIASLSKSSKTLITVSAVEVLLLGWLLFDEFSVRSIESTIFSLDLLTRSIICLARNPSAEKYLPTGV